MALEQLQSSLDALDVAANGSSPSDAVGRLAWGLVLEARRAAFGAIITPHFADLTDGSATNGRCGHKERLSHTLHLSQACPVLLDEMIFFLTSWL